MTLTLWMESVSAAMGTVRCSGTVLSLYCYRQCTSETEWTPATAGDRRRAWGLGGERRAAAGILTRYYCESARAAASTVQGGAGGPVAFSPVSQHCKASPKLPVLPTNPDGSPPSAEAAGTGVDGWDEP